MEILSEIRANDKQYAIKVLLFSNVEALQGMNIPESVMTLYRKKKERKDQEVLWVETELTVYFFVKLLQANDYEEQDAFRKHGAKVFDFCNSLQEQTVLLHNVDASSQYAHTFVEGFVLSSYNFDKYKSEKTQTTLTQLVCVGDFGSNISDVSKICNAVFAARDVVNEPVSALPSDAFARSIEKQFDNTSARVMVYGKQWIQEQGMGGLLAVNQGSVDDPRFVHIVWNPCASEEQPIVLIGKGIVFDTGGLSLKTPSTYMETMKADMGGAAAVMGVLKAIVDMQLPVHVQALIPITDNRPGGNAYAPGDVITMHNGKTVEVLNTDAEGRMILADALSFASSLNPKLTIDVATLTGAANAAVGEHAAVFMGTAIQEMKLLEQISYEQWEPLVTLPLWKLYDEQIKSEIADMKNVGGPLAGAITAAKFLQKFVSYPWIHLDISGSAFLRTKSSYKGVGATGFGVRTLVSFITSYANNNEK